MSRSLFTKLALLVAIIAIPVAYIALRPEAKTAGLSPKQTTIEYRKEAASLKLAPGWTWPGDPAPSQAADGHGIMYEKGWGKQAADYYSYCSWASRATDPKIPPADRKDAIENAASITNTYYFNTSLDPGSRPQFANILKEAERGDLAGLKQDYEFNCPKAPTKGTSG